MAAPVNVSDLELLFDPNRKPMFVGKPAGWWNQHGKLLAEQSAFVAESDCRGLVATVLELQRDDYWRQFGDDWGEFCQDVFDRPAAWIEQVVQGVRLLLQANPQATKSAVPATAARGYAQAALDLEGTFAKTGDNQHTRTRGVYTINTSSTGALVVAGGGGGLDIIKTTDQNEAGTSASYLAARLKKAGRDDLLEQVRDGAIRSVRAAAIEAGIVKDVPVVRLTSPEKAAAAIRRHWSSDQVQALCVALSSTC